MFAGFAKFRFDLAVGIDAVFNLHRSSLSPFFGIPSLPIALAGGRGGEFNIRVPSEPAVAAFGSRARLVCAFRHRAFASLAVLEERHLAPCHAA